MDRMGRIKANDECGVMNDEYEGASSAFNSSLLIHHSSFLLILSIPVNSFFALN
jgi:hypothetical protein